MEIFYLIKKVQVGLNSFLFNTLFYIVFMLKTNLNIHFQVFCMRTCLYKQRMNVKVNLVLI